MIKYGIIIIRKWLYENLKKLCSAVVAILTTIAIFSMKDNADCCDRGDGVNANDAKAISMIEAGFITAKDFPIKSSQLKQ